MPVIWDSRATRQRIPQEQIQQASECWLDQTNRFFRSVIFSISNPDQQFQVTLQRTVMDNLNTHTPSSLYQTFVPTEARRILHKLEIHSTPVHGSWLNMAEIELSALTRQCLSRRIGTQEELEREVHVWQQRHNEEARTINWRFTTADARIKLKRLYPSLEKKKSSSSTENVAKED